MTFYRWKGLPPHNRLVPRQLFSPCNHPLLFVIPPAPACWTVPRFPISQLLPATAYVVLLKENHMQLIEAAILDRKSGAGEGSAVRPSVDRIYRSSPLSFFVIWRGCGFFDLPCFAHPARCFQPSPQNRHPERSAPQICRIKKGLQREVEGPRRCLLADAIRSFPATNIKSHNL